MHREREDVLDGHEDEFGMDLNRGVVWDALEREGQAEAGEAAAWAKQHWQLGGWGSAPTNVVKRQSETKEVEKRPTAWDLPPQML